jgi:hypothetical protein
VGRQGTWRQRRKQAFRTSQAGAEGQKPKRRKQGYDAAFFALYSAQRFFVASMMRFRPAARSLRF